MILGYLEIYLPSASLNFEAFAAYTSRHKKTNKLRQKPTRKAIRAQQENQHRKARLRVAITLDAYESNRHRWNVFIKGVVSDALGIRMDDVTYEQYLAPPVSQLEKAYKDHYWQIEPEIVLR